MSSAKFHVYNYLSAPYTYRKLYHATLSTFFFHYLLFFCDITLQMANNLRKYKFTGGSSATGPKASSSSESPPRCNTQTPQPDDRTEVVEMKAEILSSLKEDIATLFRSELKTVLAEEFENIKSELQAVRTELANNTAAIRSEVETMKTTMSHMEAGLSSCSDDVTSLLTKVGKLQRSVICGGNVSIWKGE